MNANVRKAAGSVLALWVMADLVHARAWALAPQDVGRDRIAAAATRGLAVVQKAAAGFPNRRACFSCHHQTLPLLAMTTARRHGLQVDERLLRAQEEFIRDAFEDQLNELTRGVSGMAGRALTAGYALWALDLTASRPDDTTEALATYLLKTQAGDGHWPAGTNRPPLQESAVACTLAAVRGLHRYAAAGQRARVDAALARARIWLETAPAACHEDLAMRLAALHWFGAPLSSIEGARQALLATQRDDGGWGQLDRLPSDAYATGQALFILLTTGRAASESACRRGLQFLLQARHADGSWLVVSRSRPAQTFFNNGDPHGMNQFISIAATSWAVAALAAALPTRGAGPPPDGADDIKLLSGRPRSGR